MIFADAGEEERRKELKQQGPCPVGSAIVTPGFWLAAKYIIHAVGPQWKGGNDGEKEQLYSCCQTAMRLAKDKGCQSIAFPIISAGHNGYPKEAAWLVARQAVDDFRRANSAYPMEVTFAVKYEDEYELGCKVLGVKLDENRPAPYRRHPIVRFHGPKRKTDTSAIGTCGISPLTGSPTAVLSNSG